MTLPSNADAPTSDSDELAAAAATPAIDYRDSQWDEEPDESWSTAKWLASLSVTEILADGLVRPGTEDHLAALRALASKHEAKATLRRRLDASLDALTDRLHGALIELAAQRSATADELHDKFVHAGQGFELQYASLSTFYQGMQGIVGALHQRVAEQMKREHCGMADSDVPFTTGNYDMTTTSRTEYWFVVDPERGWPSCRSSTIQGGSRQAEQHLWEAQRSRSHSTPSRPPWPSATPSSRETCRR